GAAASPTALAGRHPQRQRAGGPRPARAEPSLRRPATGPGLGRPGPEGRRAPGPRPRAAGRPERGAPRPPREPPHPRDAAPRPVAAARGRPRRGHRRQRHRRAGVAGGPPLATGARGAGHHRGDRGAPLGQLTGRGEGSARLTRRGTASAPPAGSPSASRRCGRYLICDLQWVTMTESYLSRIGNLIRDARRHKDLTQAELAALLGTSQSAIARIEQGKQNLSLEMLARIGEKLDSEIVKVGSPVPQNLRITGGVKLSGEIDVRTSKNAAVALLCASLLNKGRTTLRNLARIEEVNRITEVLTSIGFKIRWLGDSNDLEIVPPAKIDLGSMDEAAARRTRTIIMFLGPLLHEFDTFELPYAGGCDLGTRTVEPHMTALRQFGLEVTATMGSYHAVVDRSRRPVRPIVLTERGDTVTENVLLAAARHPGETVIRNASPNYMVQDLCF